MEPRWHHKSLLLHGIYLAALLMVLPFGVPTTWAQTENRAAEPSRSTNPTSVLITPRQGQSISQQVAEQNECYFWASELIDWDPYQGYQALVEQGYAPALDRSEMMKDLEELALTGAIAGEMAEFMAEQLTEQLTEPFAEPLATDDPGDSENDAASGAAMGAVMALAWAQGWLDLDLLLKPADPQAQRAVNRYERNLRKWETKFSSCLKKKGYRVSSH